MSAFYKTAHFLYLTQLKRTRVVPNICLQKYFGEGNTNLRGVQVKQDSTVRIQLHSKHHTEISEDKDLLQMFINPGRSSIIEKNRGFKFPSSSFRVALSLKMEWISASSRRKISF